MKEKYSVISIEKVNKISYIPWMENIIQLGYEPNRIDLLVTVEGLDFQEAYINKIIFEIDGIKLNFLSIDDLIIAKKTSGRPQDLADADYLTKLKEKAKKK
ncbi:MAG: hypothetical protein KKD38_08765 [Candidatus Delongbacteria bacterium]|nr:hypothetical protein [Candidatus Delongbacteria bacterium]MCG2761445.1 hypothetical protein [Candidatus Delongbacteria bacterium]